MLKSITPPHTRLQKNEELNIFLISQNLVLVSTNENLIHLYSIF